MQAGLATGLGAVWTTRLSTGQPLAGVNLELRDQTNRVLWQGQSDANGLAALLPLASLALQKDKARPWMGPQIFLRGRNNGNLAVLPYSWSNDLILLPALQRRLPELGALPAVLGPRHHPTAPPVPAGADRAPGGVSAHPGTPRPDATAPASPTRGY
ncbi:hypothetical protein DFAR_1100012 [Desulfarculales bacterium]